MLSEEHIFIRFSWWWPIFNNTSSEESIIRHERFL